MAANKSQGSYFGLFLVMATVLCAGIAYMETGFGKLTLVIGAVGLLASLAGFLKIKPEEGKIAARPAPEGMKLAGVCVALLGWLLTLGGLHIVDTVGGRMIFALLGIGVSLFGIVYILPAVFNKNAVWKGEYEPSGHSEFKAVSKAANPTMEHTR
jgi:hypothetical protein